MQMCSQNVIYLNENKSARNIIVSDKKSNDNTSSILTYFFTFKEESKLGKMVKKHTEKLSIFVGPASNFKKDKFTDLFHAKRIIGIK